jgi:hypothetical protein
MAAILDQAWLQGKFEKVSPKYYSAYRGLMTACNRAKQKLQSYHIFGQVLIIDVSIQNVWFSKGSLLIPYTARQTIDYS